ncbi:MAG: hypothetical protein ACI8TP_004037 [Acidimicrobiales bacterium]|jgi:hypothetical protein
MVEGHRKRFGASSTAATVLETVALVGSRGKVLSDDAESGGLKHRSGAEMHVHGPISETILDPHRRSALGGNSIGHVAVVDTPVSPTARERPGEESAIRVDCGCRDGCEGLVVFDEAGQALPSKRAEPVVVRGVDQRRLFVLVEKAEVDVKSGAGLLRKRSAQEREVETKGNSPFAHKDPEHEDVIDGADRIVIVQCEFELRFVELDIGRFDDEPAPLRCEHDVIEESGGIAERSGSVDHRPRVRIANPIPISSLFEQVSLELDADLCSVAEVAPRRDRTLQGGSARCLVRGIVEAQMGDSHSGTIILPRRSQESRRRFVRGRP